MSLAGKTVAFTGSMVGMTRQQAAAAAKAAGAMIGSATSKNIDYLFAGEGATPEKTMKAQQNGVQVLTAPQFNQFVPAGAPAIPVAQQPMMQPTPVMKAPRGRKPRAAMPVAETPVAMSSPMAAEASTGAMPWETETAMEEVQATPMMSTPAPMAEVPAYEEPSTGAMPWETEMVGEAAPAAVMAPKPRRGRTPKAAMPVATPAMPAAQPAMEQPTAMPVTEAMPQPKFSNKVISLPGKTVTFTGTLETATREEASAIAQQAGASVHAAITPNTSYLVCGANPGKTKLIASHAAGVPNISEGQFMKAAAPAVNAMAPMAPMMQPAMPVGQQPMMQQQPAMMKAPRGRPRSASPAAPMMATPAPMAEVPAYEEPSTGAMPWETEMVGEAAPAPAAVMTTKPRRARTPKAAMPAAQPAMPVATSGPIALAGQNVVFTGSLQVNRVVAATMVTKAGGFPQSSLSAKTTVLVYGENAGPKLAKAQSMGIRCFNEAEFVASCKL